MNFLVYFVLFVIKLRIARLLVSGSTFGCQESCLLLEVKHARLEAGVADEVVDLRQLIFGQLRVLADSEGQWPRLSLIENFRDLLLHNSNSLS